MVAAAPAEARVPLADLPFEPPAEAVAAVRVIASITHTLGGLRVDERARVLREDASAVEGLWAAGVDAGGVAVGGYASGLAQALVLGLAAAEDAART
jgi:predicted oxidoreductase